MRSTGGWTLVETLACVGVIALLSATVIPSLAATKERSRLVACAAGMHDIHNALMTHLADHDRRFPPFAFSDWNGNLPLSGHWGGHEPGDPVAAGRRGTDCVNLPVLVRDGRIRSDRLVCPGAEGLPPRGPASYFPRTRRFSTYCLRFPPSEDLFRESPQLAYRFGGKILGVYLMAAGGQDVRVGTIRQTAPLLRVDRTYRLVPAAACGDGVYDPASDALLADAFWRRDTSAPAPAGAAKGYAVRAGWCHGTAFNVVDGGGAVRTIIDDGTIEANCLAPQHSLPDDGQNYATYAERVWQFLDARR